MVITEFWLVHVTTLELHISSSCQNVSALGVSQHHVAGLDHEGDFSAKYIKKYKYIINVAPCVRLTPVHYNDQMTRS